MYRTLFTVSALCLLTGCAHTTEPSDFLAQCPKPAQPDQRLLETPEDFAPASGGLDTDLLPIATHNNIVGKDARDRLVELQRWIKERVNEPQ